VRAIAETPAWTKRGWVYHWTPWVGICRFSFAILASPCACGKRAEPLFLGSFQKWLDRPPEGAKVCGVCAAAAVANELEGGK
jgi:hypothetical protein